MRFRAVAVSRASMVPLPSSSIESNETNQVKTQVAVTVSLVFATLLIRAAYSFILAYASFTSAIVQTPTCVADSALDNACINKCSTLGFVIKNWLLYTPSFRSHPLPAACRFRRLVASSHSSPHPLPLLFSRSVSIIASPIALIICIWGMTSSRLRVAMAVRTVDEISLT